MYKPWQQKSLLYRTRYEINYMFIYNLSSLSRKPYLFRKWLWNIYKLENTTLLYPVSTDLESTRWVRTLFSWSSLLHAPLRVSTRKQFNRNFTIKYIKMLQRWQCILPIIYVIFNEDKSELLLSLALFFSLSEFVDELLIIPTRIR